MPRVNSHIMSAKQSVSHFWNAAVVPVKALASHRVFRLTTPFSILFLFLAFVVPYGYVFSDVRDLIAIPLHYNIHFGVDLFGTPWRIFTASLLGLIILFVNTILAAAFWKRQRMLSYGLLCATVLIEIVLFVASIFTTLLVLSYL